MKQPIVTMDVDVSNLDTALISIIKLSSHAKGAYICVSNVHMCMETFDSLPFRKVVNRADFVIADGRPISWAQQLMGHDRARQVRGQDIMSALCEKSNNSELSVGFYGGSSEAVLEKIQHNLKQQFPNIKITYAYAPPFRALSDEEDGQLIESINSANVDILFVGIGCPKQEYWMSEHRASLNCVMLGVGAAFDFIAGNKKYAPRWVQKIGLEWLFRLLSEPKRLWMRYLKQNPRFIYYFARQLIKHKMTNA